MNKRTEGIILKSTPFQDYDRILTLFSPEQGLIKLILKGSSKPSSLPPSLLTRAEFVYTKGKSDLYKCNEVHAIDQHLAIRNSLESLTAACEMAQAILSTQFPEKASPHLYELYLRYLKHIPALDPGVLTTSFWLKVLRHEGLFKVQEACSQCRETLQTWLIAEGESFCKTHAPAHAIAFEPEEILAVMQLAHCLSFAQLKEIVLSASLKKKIHTLFSSSI